MSIDLSKLTPAPWDIGGDLCLGPGKGFSTSEADFAFISLARNAFDVMMRRRWDIFTHADGFQACGPNDFEGPLCQDPFTALVEADHWMAEKEKANG